MGCSSISKYLFYSGWREGGGGLIDFIFMFSQILVGFPFISVTG